MDSDFFERLLYEEESTTLDFKREQYRFAKASEEEKSEPLKDILGFANAWKRSDAYILIGIEDVRGGRGNVIGIPAAEHLDDHSLQQFVNNLTNRPVRFQYEAFGFEGKQVGIIRVENQPRPLYLKKDYGKLKRNEVYVRRGSSTDPTKPASLEEVAQMGLGSGPHSAELIVEFAEVDRDESRGARISWEAEFCDMPPMSSIPDYASKPHRRAEHGIHLSDLSFDPADRRNEAYFRELANYEFMKRLFRPVRLAVKNVGQVAAKSVRIEFVVPIDIGIMVIDSSELPDPPKRRTNVFAHSALDLRHGLRRSPGEMSIDKNDERFQLELDCGDLQPGRRMWSNGFYIGKGTSGDLLLNGQIFAENLPQPKDFILTLSANVTRT